MKIHELKIYPQYFEKVLDGSKTFELRKDDRGYEVGDRLILREFKAGLVDHTQGEPVIIQEEGYTGRKIEKQISYIFKGGGNGFGLKTGFSILALKDISEIREVTERTARMIIKYRRPLGLFFTLDNKTGDYVGIDNLTGHAWVEEFTDKEDCFKWLKEEEE